MAAIFQAADLPVRTRAGQKISDALADADTSAGDLLGLSDWLIITRADIAATGFGEALASARALAMAEGRKHAAVLQFRYAAISSGHFALMEVGDLADLIRELEQLKAGSASALAGAR